MIYCDKCGNRLDDSASFCPKCGHRVIKNGNKGAAANSVGNTARNSTRRTENHRVEPNSVQYVYVNKKTGKITNNPHVKTGSEGCFQYLVIAFAAVAMVIVMVGGSVFLTDYFSENSGIIDSDYEADVTSQEEVSSWDNPPEVSSEPVSSEIVSSRDVSSEPGIPEEQTAKYLNKKIKGKWRTDIPYKNMTLPGTFEFDGNGNAKCTVKAFLFSKKFTGSYVIKDGGRCTLTLDGLEEFFDDNTMVGDLVFIDNDNIEFTVDNTAWKLNRTE